jgi:hypothetical protein
MVHMPAAARDLTGEEIERFRQLYAAGFSTIDIGPMMGMNPVTLKFRLRRAGVPLRPRDIAKRMPLANRKKARYGAESVHWKGTAAQPHTGRRRARETKERKPPCELCGSAKTKRWEIHHRDGNPLNNELSNLLCVCAKCHKTFHRHSRRHRASHVSTPTTS